MDRISNGVKIIKEARIQYQHNQHKELAIAISDEKDVVDSLHKVASAKSSAVNALSKWVSNESSRIIRLFYMAITDIDKHNVGIHKEYTLQYERYRGEFKTILRAEEMADELEKKLDQKQSETTKLSRKVAQSKRNRNQYETEYKNAKEEVVSLKRQLTAAKINNEAVKNKKIFESMRILTRATETLHVKNLLLNETKQKINQLYFSTQHDETNTTELEDYTNQIINEMADTLQLNTSDIAKNLNLQRLNTNDYLVSRQESGISDGVPNIPDRPPNQPLKHGEFIPNEEKEISKKRLEGRQDMPLPALPPQKEIENNNQDKIENKATYVNNQSVYDNCNETEVGQEHPPKYTPQSSSSSLPPYPTTEEESNDCYLTIDETNTMDSNKRNTYLEMF